VVAVTADNVDGFVAVDDGVSSVNFMDIDVGNGNIIIL
jgi:hypothetical protein